MNLNQKKSIKILLYFFSLIFSLVLSGCDQKVRFETVKSSEKIKGRPECVAPTPKIEGALIVPRGSAFSLTYTNSTEVNWYIILPTGEQVFRGENLNLLLDQVGEYPGLVWGVDNCQKVIQKQFTLKVEPFIGKPVLTINNNEKYTRTDRVTLQLFAEAADEMYVTNDSQCLTGGEWINYSKSLSWTLDKESAEARVYARFRVDNVESDCVSDDIVFDKTPPLVSFVKVPEKSSYQSQAYFKIQASDNISGVEQLQCQLNNSGYEKCFDQITLKNLNYGAHHFSVRAIDKAGNFSAPLDYSWDYLNQPPRVQLTRTPAVSTFDDFATFEFTAEDDGGVIDRTECRLNQETFIKCQSPLFLSGLSQGTYTFQVRAYDPQGLVSETVEFQWDILKKPAPPVPPKVYFTKVPDHSTEDTKAHFAFEAEHSGVGIKNFFCQQNNQAYSVCRSPLIVDAFVGQNTLSVYAIDNNDLMSNVITHRWNVRPSRKPIVDEVTVTSKSKKIDIIVVIDNSPSMKEEQAKMAQRFSTFIDTLSDIDWQLAIITTDARAGQKEYQDGRFVPFKGLKDIFVINSQTPKANEVFAKTVRRSETGSSTEEGIHSLLKSFSRPDQRYFFRENSHVATIIVSDEDERSNGKNLNIVNQPDHLIQRFNEIFGQKNTFSNHSIVLLPDFKGNKKCPQVGDHFAGLTYIQLSQKTQGTVGDICADDYGAHLRSISENIKEKAFTIKLQCHPKEKPLVQILPNPTFPVEIQWRGDKVNLKPYPPVGSRLRITYYCD